MLKTEEEIEYYKKMYTKEMSDPREIALTEKMIELIAQTESSHMRILHYMRKKSIESALDFMNRQFYDRGTKWQSHICDQDGIIRNMGIKTYQRKLKIQKILAEENKKALKKVPITTYKWELV